MVLQHFNSLNEGNVYNKKMNIISTQDCMVCQKHQGKIFIPGGPIFENELIFISHALPFGKEKDHYLGHIFIETKRHIPELSQLIESEAEMIGLYTQRISKALMETLGMVHVYSFVIGDGVPHFHVHIIGRYPNAPREYWGAKVDEWPEAPRGANEKIAQVTGLLKTYFLEYFPI